MAKKPADKEMFRVRGAFMRTCLEDRRDIRESIKRAFAEGWRARGENITLRDVVKAADDAGHGVTVAVGSTVRSDQLDVIDAERRRVRDIIERRMTYYSETSGVMFALGSPDGQKAAHTALDAVRLLSQELAESEVDPAVFLDGRKEESGD